MNLAWIPNSLTMGNLLCGFISVIFSSQGTTNSFFWAGLIILGAALLDGLDGPVARILKVQSELGGQLDSLADCVTFGVAPGYLAYQSYFSGIIVPIFGKPIDLGIFIASIFPICVAYRLARFNVIHVPNAFSGLPAPVGGIIVALTPICFYNIEIPRIIYGIFFVLVGIMMVSTFKYSKPQSYIFENLYGIKLIIFLVIIAALIIFLKQWAVLVVILLYMLSGILSFIIQFIQDHKY